MKKQIILKPERLSLAASHYLLARSEREQSRPGKVLQRLLNEMAAAEGFRGTASQHAPQPEAAR